MMNEIPKPASRQTVREKLETIAKGGDVYAMGPGIAWVARDEKPMIMDPGHLTREYGWYVDSVLHNQQANEVALFAFPIRQTDIEVTVG